MRFIYHGPPDEPGVGETIAFGQHWVTGEAAEAVDTDAVPRLLRHPHFEVEDEAHGFEVAQDGEPGAPPRRGPGRPRKVVD